MQHTLYDMAHIMAAVDSVAIAVQLWPAGVPELTVTGSPEFYLQHSSQSQLV